MRLSRTPEGAVLESDGKWYEVPLPSWDSLFTQPEPEAFVKKLTGKAIPRPTKLLAPVGTQEIWASGVTYFRSRTARMEESKAAGGGNFYDRVYSAERPELFFKSTAPRVRASGEMVRIRRDSAWNVPEPELVLAINHQGKIIGYTIGNDMSSRSIEGENPLYLPQAKVYDGSCAMGPSLWLSSKPLPPETTIGIKIVRKNGILFEGATSLAQMKRKPKELAQWLFREMSFPQGVFLFTGTGIVPEANVSLQPGDDIAITIDPIGALINRVAEGSGVKSLPFT